MKQSIVTAPAYYPLVLDQAKEQLKVVGTDNDKEIQSLIPVVTDNVEQYLSRRLVTQTWKVWLDAWPSGDSIELPFGNLQSVTHVKYTETDTTENTWSTDYYSVDTDSEPGRVVLKYGQSWPTESLGPDNPIEIQFVCGYGANAVQAITGATNASPIAVTIAGHGHATGDQVYVYDVAGNTAANGTWKITVSDLNTFSLNGSTGNAAYTSGGSCVKQSVPDNILHAMKVDLSSLYENREDEIVGTTYSRLHRVANLLSPYRMRWFE